MLTKVSANYLRISPRKTCKVTGLIKGLPVMEAEAILDSINKRPSLYIKRLIKSAVDSANKRFNVSPAELYIFSISVNKGPMLKRYRSASMGRGTMIKHRTAHITLELERIKERVKES